VSGAKLDAEATALAALDGDEDGTFGHSGEGVHVDGRGEARRSVFVAGWGERISVGAQKVRRLCKIVHERRV